MSITGFNRRRRELAAQQEADEELETTPGDLDDMPYPELRALAKERKIEEYYKMNAEDLRTVLSGGEVENNQVPIER